MYVYEAPDGRRYVFQKNIDCNDIEIAIKEGHRIRSYVSRDILVTVDYLKQFDDEAIQRVVDYLECAFYKLPPPEYFTNYENVDLKRVIIILKLYVDSFRYLGSDIMVYEDFKYCLKKIGSILKGEEKKER